MIPSASKSGQWAVYDESMLYPTGCPAIPYFILHKEGTPHQIKMVLCCEVPKTTPELQALRELAENEYADISGQWAGELVDLLDKGLVTFDLVFAEELIDARKRNQS